ncbi:MAG: PDZ domain-containing protein, partial [Alcaligenaceae bacterium]|nr:PDZ domain-containing protein [Alcaligenaceae bacterium]
DVRLKEQPQGLQILTVYENGAAHRAGLSAGDWVVAIDGSRVQTQQQWDQRLQRYGLGASLDIHVFRRDELRCYTVTLSESIAKEYEFTHDTNTN